MFYLRHFCNHVHELRFFSLIALHSPRCVGKSLFTTTLKKYTSRTHFECVFLICMRISSDFNLKIITACVDICELQILMNVLTSPQLHTGGKTSDVHGRLSVTERERETKRFFLQWNMITMKLYWDATCGHILWFLQDPYSSRIHLHAVEYWFPMQFQSKK